MLEDNGFEVIKMDTRFSPKTNVKPDFGNMLDLNELSEAMKKADGIVHLAAV